MIYFLLGVIIGILISILNIMLYQKKGTPVVWKKLKALTRDNMAQSISLEDELKDVSL